MTEIKIKVDFEKKEIHKLECEHEDKFEIAKVLLNIATGMFNKIIIKEQEESKIIKPKTKIIGGNHA